MTRLWRWLLSLFHKAKPPGPSFYGRMLNGALSEAVTGSFGTLRVWNNGASLEWVYRNNWQGFDGAMTLSSRYRLLYVLAGEPKSTLPALSDWQTFVQAAVDRAAGRVAIWEPINEPAYVCSPEIAHQYASAAYAIIKAAEPEAIVLSPSFNELQRPFESGWAKDYLKLNAPCDAIAFHSYGDPVADTGAMESLSHSPLYLTETVVTPQQLASLAGRVECVVENGQIP